MTWRLLLLRRVVAAAGARLVVVIAAGATARPGYFTRASRMLGMRPDREPGDWPRRKITILLRGLKFFYAGITIGIRKSYRICYGFVTSAISMRFRLETAP